MSRCRLPRGCIIRAPKALECSSIAGRPFLRATCAWASCQHPVKSDLSCVNVNPRGPRSCRLLFLESRSTFRCSRAGRLISPEPASDFFNSERPGTWEKSRTEEVWGEFCLCRASGGLQPLISPSDFQRQTTYSLLVSMCLIQVSSRVQNRSVYRGTEFFSDVDDVSFERLPNCMVLLCELVVESWNLIFSTVAVAPSNNLPRSMCIFSQGDTSFSVFGNAFGLLRVLACSGSHSVLRPALSRHAHYEGRAEATNQGLVSGDHRVLEPRSC